MSRQLLSEASETDLIMFKNFGHRSAPRSRMRQRELGSPGKANGIATGPLRRLEGAIENSVGNAVAREIKAEREKLENIFAALTSEIQRLEKIIEERERGQ